MAAGKDDGVAHLQKDLEREREYIQCPKCGTLVERKRRNCTNGNVGNIRQAIAESTGESRVSTEKKRTSPSAKKLKVSQYKPQIVTSDGIDQVVMSPAPSQPESSVKPANVCMVEPCFVNPNSHEAVRRLFEHLGKVCGVKQYGGAEREWLAVECDGLPFLLGKTVIHRAQIDAHRKALVAAGIPPVSSMKGAALRQELSSRNLATRGKVDDLRCRLQAAVDEQIKSGHVVLPTGSKGEFDWVVLRSGGLHWEMKLLQSVVGVLWPFVYREFTSSQGYTTDRQLEWAKGCKDHHRAYDELSRFTDGVFQELLYPYVHSCDVPTAAGFFSWAKQYSSNKTYTLLLQLTARCAFGVFVYRHGVRHNRPDVRRLGKRAMTPLIHARHHPNYQLIDLYDEEDELSYPSVLGNLLRDHWAFSRFVACEFSCRAVDVHAVFCQLAICHFACVGLGICCVLFASVSVKLPHPNHSSDRVCVRARVCVCMCVCVRVSQRKRCYIIYLVHSTLVGLADPMHTRLWTQSSKN